jgi:hypothetical protein
MKFITATAALALLAQNAAAHYIWNQLDIGGTPGSGPAGIRPNTNYNSPVIGTFFFPGGKLQNKNTLLTS